MNDKLIAGLAVAAVAPVCAVCIFGPAVLASVFAGIAGWLGGFDPVATVGLVLAAGTAVFAVVRKRRAQRAPASEAGETRR